MKIKLNKKTYNTDDYKGKTGLLLEHICYELLNDDRYNFMDRLEFTFGYILKIMGFISIIGLYILFFIFSIYGMLYFL